MKHTHRKYNKWYKELWWWIIERFTTPEMIYKKDLTRTEK